MRTTNRNKTIALVFLTAIAFFPALCQENFKPGYIIQLKGDTLNGYIDYRNWERNPGKISFKHQTSDNKVSYSPIDIAGFGALDEVYKSAIVETDVSKAGSLDELDYSYQLEIVNDTVFLQTMIQGTKSLYYYQRRFEGKPQFYILLDGRYQLLIHKIYKTYERGVLEEAENRKFVTQLSFYLQECPNTQLKLKRIKYTKENLESLFQYYYDCTRKEIDFQKKTEKISFGLGVMAGLSSTSLKFSDTDSPYINSLSFEKSYKLMPGIFLDITLPRNAGKWQIRNELALCSYKAISQYEQTTSLDRYITQTTTIGLSYLTINNLIRYEYPLANANIYANAGISNGYAIVTANDYKKETVTPTSVNVIEYVAIPKIKKYEFGWLAGLGVKWKKYSFEARFGRGNGCSNYLNLNSNTNRMFLLFGYTF